jgi:PHD/YefM family antitoxin component YafN of YafNO toxin-antitoxin module
MLPQPGRVNDRGQPDLRGSSEGARIAEHAHADPGGSYGVSTLDGNRGSAEKGEQEMLKLPEVLGVAEARNELPHVLEDVEKGRTFIIKGPRGREAFVINADVFRRLQDAYLEVVGELETIRILEDEAAVRAIRESSDEERRELFTLSEVESLVGEVDEDYGDATS